jgi:mRNA-degrading endonuclease RelE of RelBE toxin-antitoxin system
MVIVETPIFTRQLLDLLPDEDYRELQTYLLDLPDAGEIIRGGGGIRKIRWAAKGHGKRGGVRIIYYWAVAYDKILMLYMYPKSERADFSPEQVKIARKIVEEDYP